MKYKAFVFWPYNEILLAQLSFLGFDSFQEDEQNLKGYVQEEYLGPEFLDSVKKIADRQGVEWQEVEVEDKNWNAIWESSFDPVMIEDFCIVKASFHNVDTHQKFVITIDPKMAFGTGHHQTTNMMIKAMSEICFQNLSVFDYGSGTGVLAILAEKLGAKYVLALDVEQNSFENIIENAHINSCKVIEAMLGTINDVEKKFDVILANINRNVLIETALEIKARLNTSGILVLSGILAGDLIMIKSIYNRLGFGFKKKWEKGNWVAIKFVLER